MDDAQRANSGTLVIGIVYADGVLLCSESQLNSHGVVINSHAPKIEPVVQNVFLGFSGDLAMMQRVLHFTQTLMAERIASVRPFGRNDPSEKLSTFEVAHFLHAWAADQYYWIGNDCLIAGVDENPNLFCVSLSNGCLRRQHFAVGSGATQVMGDLAEALGDGAKRDFAFVRELALKLIKKAAHSDTHSNKCAQIFNIKCDSFEHEIIDLSAAP